MLHQAKDLGFMTNKRTKTYSKLFRPYLRRANALLEEVRREARRQAALREKRARDAEELMEIMDLLPSLPLLGCDHYGNRYFFLPRDYRGVYVLCDGEGVRAMGKEKEVATVMGLQRAKKEVREQAPAEGEKEVFGGRGEGE